MAQFLGTVEGQRGRVSRLGSKASGLTVKANGWKAGITVYAGHKDGKDYFVVKRTTGSNGNQEIETLAKFEV